MEALNKEVDVLQHDAEMKRNIIGTSFVGSSILVFRKHTWRRNFSQTPPDKNRMRRQGVLGESPKEIRSDSIVSSFCICRAGSKMDDPSQLEFAPLFELTFG